MDLTELSSLIYAKKLSSVEVTQRYLERIASYDPVLNAYITICADDVLEAAKTADQQLASGQAKGVLQGIPIALKDLFFTREAPTTAGSKVLQDSFPQEDAVVWKRLKDAGALLLGKTNLHEFAYGTTTENPHYGAVHNPWDLMRIAGGSSGGSAAAVAADLAPAALGTDTGGSIRIPAACSGVVGVKPTYGLVSKRGVLPLAYSLDHVGPMTRSIRDAALLLQLIAGYDVEDPSTVQREKEQYDRLLGTSLRGLRIGYDESFFFAQTDEQVKQRVRAVLKLCEEAGAMLEMVDVPMIYEVATYQAIVISSEALLVHEKWLAESAVLYGEDVRQRLASGQQYTAVDYARAVEFRDRFRRAMTQLFLQIDVLITPTIPFTATPIGDYEVLVGEEPQAIRPNLTRFTNPFNLSGLPALSLPCGHSEQGLPIGVQLVGAPFSEARLFQVGSYLEQAFPLHVPPLFS